MSMGGPMQPFQDSGDGSALLITRADEVDGDAFAAGWKVRLLWQSLPLILGLIAFELTANSMLGIAVACLKFGLDEFLTAIWFLRTDPHRTRGVACACFLGSLGFVKACVTGLAITIGVMSLAAVFRGGQIAGPLGTQIVAALLTIAGGGAAFALMMGLGITSALFGRVRIWMCPETLRARRDNQWPPQFNQPAQPVQNAAAALLRGTWLLSVFGSFYLILVALAVGGLPARPAFTLPALLISFIGCFWLMTRLFVRIQARIIAQTPWHCWPETSNPTCAAAG
jgi:hypothetical protein